MSDTTAKIRSKGLDTTGITEDVATEMFARVGSHYMAIVDLQVVDRHGPDVKGKRGVELVIDTIEPALDDQLAEHLRELNRTLYYNRGLQGHTGTTTDGQERTVEDVLSSGAKHRPHPFLPVDAADEHPICDVCGNLEAAPVHSTQDTLPDGDLDEDDDAGEDGYGQEPEAEQEPNFNEPHTYDAGPDDLCVCGLPFEDPQHDSDLVHSFIQGMAGDSDNDRVVQFSGPTT